MKLNFCALVLLACACAPGAVGQAAPNNTAPAKQHPTAAASGSADANKSAHAEGTADMAVITVPGVCDAVESTSKDCKTVITRAQFEKLANALEASRPEGLNKQQRMQLASQYADFLIYAHEAAKRGIDKDPSTEALLHFARLQVLTQRLLLSVQDKAAPTGEEIEKYYKDHTADYQAIAVQKIMIPTGHSSVQSKPEEIKALAEDLRKRLAAGEDPRKLEQEAYTKLGFKIEPPETAHLLKPGGLPPEESSVANLKAGEVSPVFTEPDATVIYKSEGPKPMPLDQVRGEISSKLLEEKVQAAGQAMRNSHKPDLNLNYFSPH